MTPKEKAKELVDKIESRAMIHDCFGSEYLVAKECALIAVDEVILANPHSNPLNTDVYSTMDYWQEVKQEIENL